MEIHVDPPIKRFKKFKRYEPVAKDSSMVKEFKKCPRSYFYRYVLGFTDREVKPYFPFGSAYHKLREVLEIAWLKEEYKNLPSREDRYKACFAEALEAALKYWRSHTKGDPVVGTRFDFMTQDRLIKTCFAGYEHWKKEKNVKGIEVVAIEQPFNIQMPDGQFTSGRFDQVIRRNGVLWGRDFKTSSVEKKMYDKQLEPNDQFTRYTWAIHKLSNEPISGLVIEVVFNDKKKGPIIFESLASRTPGQISEWLEEQEMWHEQINLAREKDNYGRADTGSPFLCGKCPYHIVCAQSNETAMGNKLEAFFDVKPWDNTKVDQDD